jgi:hypothetical protein
VLFTAGKQFLGMHLMCNGSCDVYFTSVLATVKAALFLFHVLYGKLH